MLRSSHEIAELLGRVASRDQDAFRVLYSATSAKLYGTILPILARRSVADEVLQDIYVKIWERAKDFDASRASPITWMCTIARNRAIDEVRRAGSLSTAAMPDDFEMPSLEEDPLAARERSDELRSLLRCLDGLDGEKREAVLLAYYRGVSREALAQRFRRPVPTIKTWLHRSLSQLRLCLSQ